MASFILRVPTANLRGFSVSAAASSSNGTGTGSTQKAGPMIVELPLDQIKRPLMRTRANDPNKVQELMQSIQQIGLQVPVKSPMNMILLKFLLTVMCSRPVQY
ncbi:unnamed protein product [Linum tenue]|nr:unnamed protein product [Linum tenue]